jgi:hypothetical protein
MIPTRRTSKEEEDDDNNEEEDWAAAAAAATTAAATAATTAGCLASSAATASDQAVAAAWRSNSDMQWGMVAPAADFRIPSLTPVFLCFLSECSLHVAQNTMFFMGPSLRIPAGFRVLENSGTN